MSKSGSKNNAAKRTGAQEFFFEGKKIKPIKIIAQGSSILGVEDDQTGDILLSEDGSPISWRKIMSQSNSPTKN